MPSLPVLVLAALCWLAAGPGCVTLQAIIACTHHAAPQGHRHHGTAPTGAPCFCDHMTGASDQVVSVALPAAPVAAALSVPGVRADEASRISLPTSRTPTPESPPPIALA